MEFGYCGNSLFGGPALFDDSHLNGHVTVTFFPTGPTTAHFTVSMGTLTGDDGTVTAPLGYNFPVTFNSVSDYVTLSSGDLDLTTGYVNPNSIQWVAAFQNSGLLAIGNVNPNLSPPVVNFPGARGIAWANFVQRPDGLLDFYFRGSTFLPLGNDINGQTVRFPLPFCNPSQQCVSILARGTSLHPHLQLDTRDSLGYTPCAPNCRISQPTKLKSFGLTPDTDAQSFGDDFDLRIPQLGGRRSRGAPELQGRVQLHFGAKTGDNTIPFQLSLLPPEGLFAEPPNSPLLGPGFRGVMMGTNQQLHFPNYVYNQHKLYFADEVYNRASGSIDLNSGQIIGEFIYPMYIDQSIIEQLIPDNHGRVTLDPFFQVAMRAPQDPTDLNYAFLEKEKNNGQTTLRLNLFHHRSFETYCYPMPQFVPNECWIALPGTGSNLNIFGKIQAAPSRLTRATRALQL